MGSYTEISIQFLMVFLETSFHTYCFQLEMGRCWGALKTKDNIFIQKIEENWTMAMIHFTG